MSEQLTDLIRSTNLNYTPEKAAADQARLDKFFAKRPDTLMRLNGGGWDKSHSAKAQLNSLRRHHPGVYAAYRRVASVRLPVREPSQP